MNRITFVRRIISLYQTNKSTDPAYPNVIRGRGRTIASEAEDLFGIYISELLADGYTIYVDVKIKVGEDIFFPDIAICKNNKVLQMWDLKMDLGWIRGKIWSIMECRKDFIDKIKDKTIDLIADHRNSFKFAKDITYNFLIITLCNGGKDASNVFDYAQNKQTANGCQMKDKDSKVFYIFKHRSIRKNHKDFKRDDYHPNWGFQYKDDLKKLQEYDLEQKMSYGTFAEMGDFILALKNTAK